ncbi:DUF4340 domain-containing protein [Roseomonas xinghualingensis]|uniref:DUF4340 domain-containing protein n=1 Tax=Roseomonas xinghualingensis TaxID=2986475 RepID=UPI0021F1C116|nr:DUF4340 domain-containing protein [Roseomonas sp. SXEYE001]MCV4209784.1 DUF4340 domain-containing protein [Roseomonas sp. SXEYE001]
MPLNRRHLIALGGSAVVVLGAAALLVPQDDAPPPVSESPLAFPALSGRLQAAQRIELRQGEQNLVVQRGPGEAWRLPSKGGYSARFERVRELLIGLAELRLAERRTADPESLSRLGLGEPGTPGSTALLLRVLDGAGSPLAELVIGRRRTRTQGGASESAYVRRPGENQSYLAEGRIPVDADAQLWLDRGISNLPNERVRRVIAVRDGQTVELLREEGPDGRLRIVLPGDAPPADDVSLDEVGRALEGLTFLDVRPAAEIPGDPAGEGRFILTDDLIVTARLRNAGGDVWMTITATGGEEAERLDARWRGWAYQVGAWKLPAFAPSLQTLRKREG